MRLADLQLRMMALDLTPSRVQTTVAVVLVGVGTLAIGGAITVGLTAAGWALANAWRRSPGVGLAIAGRRRRASERR